MWSTNLWTKYCEGWPVEDLLDKAWGLEQTSRLSCQAIPPDEEEIEIELPKYTRFMIIGVR